MEDTDYALGRTNADEWVARATTTGSAIDHPSLARLQDLMARTFALSGAQLETGAELYWRMLDAGLEPEPRPLAEIAVHMCEGEVIDLIDNGLRDELLLARGLAPLSWLMIGRWGRKPTEARGA